MLRRLAVVIVALLALAPAVHGAVPAPDASAYLLINPATGEILAEKAPDRELPMASTTKIMTALVVLERARLDDLYTVPEEAVEIGESSGQLVAGERISVRHLLTALLVSSGNDAAIVLADGLAGSQSAFVAMMNERARRLGLTHTSYANSHGLDAPGHHTSVRDLIRLSQVAMRRPFFREQVAHRRASIPGPGGSGTRYYESENDLLDIDQDADGVKTGHTDGAGYSLVAHARRRGLGMELYAAAIGFPSEQVRADQTKALLDWGFSQYARPTLVAEGAVVGRAPVRQRPGVSVPYRVESGLSAPIRLGVPLTERIVAPRELVAPVRAGQEIGTITLLQGQRVVGERRLVTAAGAGEPSLLDRVRAGIEALLP